MDPAPGPRSRRWSRRGVLGAAGLATASAGCGVLTGALPGRSLVRHRLGLDGPDGMVPDVEPGPSLSGAFDSPARGGRRTGWTIAVPPGSRVGSARLPVAVVLHGRGDDHRTAFSTGGLGLDRYLAAAVHDGATPYAMASVDGGTSYWHPRTDGEDAGAMVVQELLPLLAKYRLDVDRLAFLGWSMGGFGALRLAGILGSRRVAATTAMSPALWRHVADAAPGAFDGAADLARCSVLGRQHQLAGVRLRIDCGRDDPFYATTRSYVAGFADRPAGGFERGGHTKGYWRRMAPAHVRFLADAFAPGAG